MLRSSILREIKSTVTSLFPIGNHSSARRQANAFSTNTSCLNQRARLAEELQKMQAFLPAPEVRLFDPNNVSQKFDFQNSRATSLSFLYDAMAFSFWFEREVQDLYIHAKGSFSVSVPVFSGTMEEALGHCISMALLINKIAPKIMDRNLIRVWAKLEDQYKFPHLETAEEMRNHLKCDDTLLKRVTILDLSSSDIEIIPPEVLLFPNLTQVSALNTPMTQFPQVLTAHPTLNLDNVQFEDLTFTMKTDWQETN
ncbi:MAG: leucine-rich repeat domain-containing protein [Simkania sp.]|nr:leucine-rich repeat domain-containing protein [Simkania sp.]